MDSGKIACKVSCLCITLGRPQLTEAYADYMGQTHVNRELVLVVQERNPLVSDLIRHTKSVKIITGRDDATLGELRMLAIKHATGDFMIQWDDDDRYTPHRIQRQLAHHLELKHPLGMASFIDNFLLYNQNERKLHWIRRGGRGKPGSILFGKECPVSYSYIPRSEDQEVMEHLYRNKLAKTIHPGIVYLRRFHGENTWDYQHYLRLVKGAYKDSMVRAYGKEIQQICEDLIGTPVSESIGFR